MTKALIEQIKAALSTDEDNGNLVDVARNAHKAELKLARLSVAADNKDYDYIKRYFGMPVRKRKS